MRMQLGNLAPRRNLVLLSILFIGLTELALTMSGYVDSWRLALHLSFYTLLIFLIIPIWIKTNYIGYTKRLLYIRVGSKRGRFIRLKAVERMEFDKGLFRLQLKDGYHVVCDLDDVDPDERRDFIHFIKEFPGGVVW